MMKGNKALAISALAILALVLGVANARARNSGAKGSAVIPQLTVTPTFVDITPPANGDVNPYGVAFVPEAFPGGGILHPGDIIVSNFNNSSNLQGTGTTIVRVNNNSNSPTLFFQDADDPGLTTALGVLKAGFILVGNLPSTDNSGVCNAESGPMQNVGQGALLVIDRKGNLLERLTSASLLNGPWDLTVKDEGPKGALVFVANALSGTVTRLNLGVVGGQGKKETLVVQSETQIASGYLHRCDPSAFVVGPTGLALDEATDTLYVSSTGDNAIFAIPDASGRSTDAGMGVIAVPNDENSTNPLGHLHGPLGLVLTSNGDFISTQGDAVNPDPSQPSEVVEFTHQGQFVAQISVDKSFGGAFGIAIREVGNGFVFATVDDNSTPPVLNVWVSH